ncbi:MAG TPA: glycosyltransferase [Thermoanaerobaculia bacterium]|nr:glycosyltransferase [Thermoanaerobaculia bacterium]
MLPGGVSAVSGLSILLGAGLLGLALRTARHRRHAPGLPAAPTPGEDLSPQTPAVTILLPVRDEESNILSCLKTLLAQTDRPFVRVIDDGSADATAALAREAADEQARAEGTPRLEILEAGPLPPGWRGKVHALAAGERGVRTPWLLSTDADTRHHPELLARARAAAEARGLDAVSIAGGQEARGLGENLLIPLVFAFLDALLGDWGPVADGAGPPVANGQFILLRREVWERCGGFESVRNETIDDVAAVARVREQGGRTGFLRAPGLLRIRMYRGTGEAVRGWRRNLGGLFGGAPGLVTATLAVLLLPPAALAAALVAGEWLAALFLWGAGALSSSLFRAGSRNAPLYGLLYPLDALLLAAVLALGVADRRRGRLVSWKGREIKV